MPCSLYCTREETLELGKEKIAVYSVEHCGFDSTGSYDESLLQKKTHRCFQKLRKQQPECPDCEKFDGLHIVSTLLDP